MCHTPVCVSVCTGTCELTETWNIRILYRCKFPQPFDLLYTSFLYIEFTSACKNLGAARNLSELVIATVLMYNGQHVAFYQVADFHCTPERFIGVIFRSKMDIPVQQPWIHWLPTPVPFLSFHQPRSTGQSRQILETEKKQHIYQHKCFKTYHLIIYMHQIEYFIHYYCFIIF